jgi:hypothetical protein
VTGDDELLEPSGAPAGEPHGPPAGPPGGQPNERGNGRVTGRPNLFGRPGCPICRAARAREASHVRFLRIGTYRSESFLRQLERRAYCWRHALELATSDSAHLSSTFHALVETDLRRLQEAAALEGRRRRRALERMEPAGQERGIGRRDGRWSGRRERSRDARGPEGAEDPCPACAAGQLAAWVWGTHVLEELGDEAGRAAYLRHQGICREHLLALLTRAPEDVSAWLLEVTRERLAALRADLAEHFQPLDRQQGLLFTSTDEAAWRRALRYFWSDGGGAGEEPPAGDAEGSRAGGLPAEGSPAEPG